tara:strand:- start:1608 stop:1784 length:177 start_codon:yes stop_codon:yes gene_type:complete
MPRMTKAQAKKRLNEAVAKVKAVYVSLQNHPQGAYTCVTTQDMAAIEKIINKCLKRLS